MKRTLVNASILALAIGVLGGCATTEQINQIKAMAEQAQSTATNAAQRADNALATANDALNTARRAESAAAAAMKCCQENSSKIERMFEKAMAK